MAPRINTKQDSADQKKKDQSGFVTSLKAVTKSKDKEKAAEARQLLDAYQQLGRFDKEKDSLLDNWKKAGKKFTWVGSYLKQTSKSTAVARDANKGYGTKCQNNIHIVLFDVTYVLFLFLLFICFVCRFELADLLKMPHDCKEFINILPKYDEDSDWDETIDQEKIYKDAKMKRYKFNVTSGVSNVKTTETENEQISCTADRQLNRALEFGSSSSGGPDIKIEFKEYTDLMVQAKALKVMEVACSKLRQDLVSYQGTLTVKGSEESMGLIV